MTGEIATERLLLRPLRVEDAPALWGVLCDPAIYAYIPRDPPADVSAVRARFERIVAGPGAGGDRWLNWVVMLRDGAPIGLVEVTAHADASADVAYMLNSQHWRRRYAREAVGACIDVLSQSGVRQFDATIDARNAASRALLSSLGFSQIGTKPNAEFFKGAWSDEEMWRRTVG